MKDFFFSFCWNGQTSIEMLIKNVILGLAQA